MGERIIEWTQYGETVINPIGLGFAIIMWILILVLKRESKIVPFILIACFMTSMQRIVLLDIDFPYMRVAILIGMVMVLLSSKYKIELNKIDKVMLCYMVSSIILNTILLGGTGLIQKIGNKGVDTVMAYFFLRFLFQDIKDYNIIMKVLAVASILVAVFMLNEKLTGRNLFSVFGGVREFTMIRDGRLRAQAAIDHPILAGTFGALLIPFMWVLWNQKKKAYAIVGTISGLVITFASASSGPVLTLLSVLGGLFMWKFREKRKYFKPLIILSLIIIQLFMKAPIWFIFGKIDIAGWSTGFHRSRLIDNAINNFPDWALFGTMGTGQWGWGLQDTTNQYLVEGFNSGLLSLVLFIYIIKLCFNSVGKSLDYFKNNIENQKIAWALGVLLFGHCITFFGVSYFGHLDFLYYMSLAMLSTLHDFNLNTNIAEQGRTA